MAVPDPVTLVGVIAPHVRPDGIVSLIVTIPANPFTGKIVIVEFVEDPTLIGTGVDTVIVKFWKRNIAVAL